MKKLTGILFLLVLSLAAPAQSGPPFWKDITAFKRSDSAQLPPTGSILFTGSSSFTMWKDVNEHFPGYGIINRGFGGSTLVDVIRYAYDVILPYKPRQVVIYCGENDLAASASVSAEEVVNRFKTLFAIIRQNLPDTYIDFVSIKPSPSRAHMIDRVVQANKEISRFLRKKKRARFINVFDAMLDSSGQPREELFLQDRLHMKPEGYRIWQGILQPYLIKQKS